MVRINIFNKNRNESVSLNLSNDLKINNIKK